MRQSVSSASIDICKHSIPCGRSCVRRLCARDVGVRASKHIPESPKEKGTDHSCHICPRTISAGCLACLVCVRAWCAKGENAATAVHSSSATLPTLRIASISFASTYAAQAEGSDRVPAQSGGGEPSPGTDVARVSLVLTQMWQG
jgi:hypothetical protein